MATQKKIPFFTGAGRRLRTPVLKLAQCSPHGFFRVQAEYGRDYELAPSLSSSEN